MVEQTKAYRPVSHITEISKIVEYAVQEQTLKHFIDNNIFHPNLHGFLPQHSTALILLYDKWLEAAENKQLSAALLIDLSAAFDVIPHGILYEKMKLYKFSPNTVNFFKSYLDDRKQIVQVGSKLSTTIYVGNRGVPQGSVLGHLIFIIFQNDFPANFEDGDSVLYADDATDVIVDEDPELLELRLQAKANKSTQWITDN